MINNAAKCFYQTKKRTLEELLSVTNTNLIGTINLINNFLDLNPKRKEYYKIINISSIYGIVSPNFKFMEKVIILIQKFMELQKLELYS